MIVGGIWELVFVEKWYIYIYVLGRWEVRMGVLWMNVNLGEF